MLVEHFTNTPCPICANNNPKVYRVIDRNADLVNHISIHTDSPYPSCELHNFNPVDNGARQDYYNVRSTPRVYINGVLSSASQEARFESDLMAAIAAPLPLSVTMQEIGATQQRQAKVNITAKTSLEASDYRIFVAVVEKTVEFNAPNGETLHRDVLRDFVTAPEGDVFTPPLLNETLNLEYNVTIPPGVAIGEAYIMVYIQDLNTGEVLGSAIHSENTTSTNDLGTLVGMQLFPNPATDIIEVRFKDQYVPLSYEILDLGGSLIHRQPLQDAGALIRVSIHDLVPGSYILVADLDSGKASTSFVKN